MSNEREASAAPELTVHKKRVSQFVGFQVAEQNYAFRIEQIQEIVILDQVTRLPQVPDFVDGVSNLRGNIIPLINLRKLFGFEPKPIDEQARTVVVNVQARTMGCIVDSVSQVIRISPEQIQPVPDIVVAEESKYITGFARVNDELIVLLDVDELLDPEKLDSVHRIAKDGLSTPNDS